MAKQKISGAALKDTKAEAQEVAAYYRRGGQHNARIFPRTVRAGGAEIPTFAVVIYPKAKPAKKR